MNSASSRSRRPVTGSHVFQSVSAGAGWGGNNHGKLGNPAAALVTPRPVRIAEPPIP